MTTIRDLIELEMCCPARDFAQRLEDEIHAYIRTWAACEAGIERDCQRELGARAIERFAKRLCQSREEQKRGSVA